MNHYLPVQGGRRMWRWSLILIALIGVGTWGNGSLQAANVSAAPLGGTPFLLPGGGFETPAVATFQYAPSGSAWNFANGSGLSQNGTGFTVGNPNAPGGAQVLFLQGNGAVSQNVDLVAGYYTFDLRVAQRGNTQASSQTVELRIDGAQVLKMTPAGTGYDLFATEAIPLTSGAHLIEIRGLNPNGGDNTAFVDELRATRLKNVPLSGFETPAIAAGNFQYAAPGGRWSLTGGGGLARNGSGFTVANPPAPQGQQVLFLQNYGQAATSVSIPHPGFYRLRFLAAHRGNNLSDGEVKQIRFTMAGYEMGEYALPSADYTEFVTTSLYLAPGTYTLTLSGINPQAGDHTGLVDDLRLEWIHDWQDDMVWGNSSPGINDDVTVPDGSAVGIRGQVNAKSIQNEGELVAAQNQDVTVQTNYLMVSGGNALLEVGQELAPYPSQANFILTANASSPDIGSMGNNFIGAMNSGTIHLHGLDKVSWSQLEGNVAANTNTLTLKENVNWSPDDEIVVVSSRANWNEAEKMTIQSVSGNQITTVQNFQYPHVGKVKTYSEGASDWTADLRAEVGLLTHNIKVEGNAAAASTGYGGHIMMMMGGKGYVEGVELYNMGQKSILGRYPWHWHMLGDDGEGQYFKNNSVHKSFNRAITIHGTGKTLVEGNFCYDHIGHGVFLEDGSETFNVIRKNVVLLTKRPLPGEELTPSDNELNEEQNRTPSSYWITNPQNTFEDNVAAGTEGTGYWFAMPTQPMGLSKNDPRFSGMQPHTLPLISFQRNSAHSCMNGFDIFDQLNPDHSIKKNAGWAEYSDHIMGNCLFYANRIAIYSGIGAGGPSNNLYFRNNVFVENFIGSMLASYSTVDSSVIVANSGENLRSENVRYAYRIYDGAATLKDCHFVGWDASNTRFFLNTGAGIKHPNHIITGATTDHTGPVNSVLPKFNIAPAYANANHPAHPRFWSIVVRDIDGGISGKANTTLVGNQPFQLVGDEYQAPNWTRMYRSDHQFALARIVYNTAAANNPNVTVTRTKAGTPTASIYYVDGFKEWHQLPLIVNEGFTYTYAYETLPATKTVQVAWEDAQIGDEVILRFKDFGKLSGVNLSSTQSGFPSFSSLAQLESSGTSGYWLEGQGDLYVKMKATVAIGQQSATITWGSMGNYGSPVLDTDGDQMSDADEITRGRHAFDASDLAAEFDNASDYEGWDAFSNIASPQVANSMFSGTSNGSGDAIMDNADYNFGADRVQHLFVRMRATTNTGAEFFFATDDQPGYSGSRRVSASYTGNGAWQTLTFNVGAHADWEGTITNLRFDPVSGVGIQFDIDWVRAECQGADADGDGVCDFADICPSLDDHLLGQTCNDGNPATVQDVYTRSCICGGVAAKTGAAQALAASSPVGVSLYPNPARDRVVIAWETAGRFTEVRLVDARGQLVRRSALGADAQEITWQFSEAQLAAGLYMVQLVGADGLTQLKLLKQ